MGIASRMAAMGASAPPASPNQYPHQYYAGAAPPSTWQSAAPPAPSLVLSLLPAIRDRLSATVAANGLGRLYTPQRLEAVAQQVAQNVDFAALASRWRLPNMELALDLASLALYDTIMFCDDSGSMAMAEDGARIEDLKLIVSKVAEIATLFDDDGIMVRFFNCSTEGNGIRSEAEASRLLSGVQYVGPTPLGSGLQRRVLQPMVYSQSALSKPALIITITDGEPDNRDEVLNVITACKERMARTVLGAKAVA